MSRIQVVDFFSGCGGMSHGFHEHDAFEVLGAVDIDRHANSTYERMLGVTPVAEDVRELNTRSRVWDLTERWRIRDQDPLVVLGCAPCQGFSSHRKKDQRADARNSLIGIFADVLLRLKPDLAIMENVPELFHERHWDHYAYWRESLEGAGYKVRAQILNLAEFGVPQERFRALVIAARDWVGFPMPSATHRPSEFRTVRDAIGELPQVASGQTDPNDPMHQASRHRKDTLDLLRLIPKDGGSRRSLPEGVGPKCLRRVDGFRDVYGRLAWERPSVSITARCRTPSCGRYVHPEQHRGLTPREAALLQGFPPDFVFEGPFDDRFRQIGNAVSPIFSLALARHVAAIWPHGSGCNDNAVEDVSAPLSQSFSSRIAAIKKKARSDDQLQLVAELN